MNSQGKEDSGHIIKKIIVPHCARGPKRCEKCKQMAKEKKYCLLQIYFQGGKVTRPVLELEIAGKTQWYEFDLLKTFTDKNEAKLYANEHEIRIIDT